MGRMTLRMPDTLHQELGARARIEGVSLNQFIVYSLTRQVSSSYIVREVPPEEIVAQRERFEKLIESLNRTSREDTKRILAERELAPPEERVSDEVARRFYAKIEAIKAAQAHS